jgi:hypothetical protein
MIQSTTEIVTILKSSIEALLSPVKVYTMLGAVTDNRYIYLTQLSENAIDEKRAFISQGFVSIQVIERFDNRSGNIDFVDSASKAITEGLTPNRLSSFGDLGNIAIFTMRFESTNSELRENESGRTAIKTLRLEYKFKQI